MAATVTFRSNSDNVIEVLESLTKNGVFTPADMLDRASTVLLSRLRTRFLKEEDSEGGHWVPSQAAIKRRAKGGTGTLFDTGSLFHSLSLLRKNDTERFLGVLPGARNTRSGVLVADYADKHLLGKEGFPVRDFLGVSQGDAESVENVLALFLSGRLKVNGN